jgi:hypothetical protein
MNPSRRLFLITYDRSTQHAVVDDVGTDAVHATRILREAEHVAPESSEVVLLSSDSIDTLRRTHSSYFGTALDRSLSALSGRD